ncbi:hypothetical protein PRIPAC_81559 [Pristionchus pacificus]|uniref:Cytochrome P450 n=1 Tax=Pristionchus pacificus TaxID=54126 RepID=A0A2A6C4M6_PRIPA|nr:hypothetical protein PRIPAC_81559 [Pristionchus pacificus]|eukprot:PDM72981.1 cytochrome P450 [Pristionchus pacificus]
MIFLLVIIGALTYVVLYYQNVRKYLKGPMPLPIIGNLYHVNQTGILVSDGEVRMEQRRAALRIKREHGMGKNLMEAQVNQSIDELLKQLKETNDGVKPFDMNMPIQLCVENVINETLFGYQFKYSNTAKFEFFINCLNRHLRGLRYQNFIEEEVNKVAKVYNTNEEPTNFVQSYLAEMKKNPQLDMANLYAIVVDFWLAGMETTSTTLRWGLLHLMKHPQAKMLSVVGRERRIEMADKPNLPYFTAAIAEIQRAANIISFLGTADSFIGGHFIPALTLQIYSVLKDDSVFERPTEFVPERFLEADGKTACKKQLDRLIPFGMGKSQCVGEALAPMELILGTLLINYRFDACEPTDLTPIGGQKNPPMLLPRMERVVI